MDLLWTDNLSISMKTRRIKGEDQDETKTKPTKTFFVVLRQDCSIYPQDTVCHTSSKWIEREAEEFDG